jgi:hypothetical protein
VEKSIPVQHDFEVRVIYITGIMLTTPPVPTLAIFPLPAPSSNQDWATASTWRLDDR